MSGFIKYFDTVKVFKNVMEQLHLQEIIPLKFFLSKFKN